MSENTKAPKWEQLYFGRMVASQEVSGLINFNYQGFRVSYADYKEISKHVESGNIDIGRFVGRSARGTYNALQDSVGLNKNIDPGLYMPASEKVDPKNGKDRITQLGVVLHECTHAIQDSKGWKMTVGHKEIMAHAAQAVFLLGFGEDFLDNNRLKAAAGLAGKIRNKKGLTQADWSDLEKEIGVVYKRTGSASKSDGINNWGG